MVNYADELITLYKMLYDGEITMASLTDLAGRLSQIAGKSRPWTGKYLHSLIRGYSGFSANSQLIEAIHTLANQQSSTDEILTMAKETKVLAVHPLPEGTVILGPARRCANPLCSVCFVPTHPRQRYHSRICARSRRR
jgi:hypothetical protein